MAKYRVKGTVEAIQWDGTGERAEEIIRLFDWKNAYVSRANDFMLSKGGIVLEIPVGSWAILLSDGEFATCSDQEFHEIYEPAVLDG